MFSVLGSTLLVFEEFDSIIRGKKRLNSFLNIDQLFHLNLRRSLVYKIIFLLSLLTLTASDNFDRKKKNKRKKNKRKIDCI